MNYKEIDFLNTCNFSSINIRNFLYLDYLMSLHMLHFLWSHVPIDFPLKIKEERFFFSYDQLFIVVIWWSLTSYYLIVIWPQFKYLKSERVRFVCIYLKEKLFLTQAFGVLPTSRREVI